MTTIRRNWAGNYTYQAQQVEVPESVEQLQSIVADSATVKVVGTRHSFNGIADTTGTHISLEKLNRVLSLDRVNHQVTVEGGIRYGELCEYLHEQGYALHNLASLPHITVAGACATATHGSGDRNGNLSTAVAALEIVQADGQKVVYTREHPDFAGSVVGIGALGVVSQLTLDVEPTFEMRQHVYDRLPLAALENNFDAIYGAAYSVSLFTDWRGASFNQVWVKERMDGGGPEPKPVPATFFGAQLAEIPRHPVEGCGTENCSEQLGVPGPWHERMPHFRMAFTPSAGEELQSEYYVPRHAAYEALCALEKISSRFAELLFVSEVRTIAADELWMSPCYKQDSVAVHFTWKPMWKEVREVLPLIEAALAPYDARPHWGKLFTMAPADVQRRFVKLPAFKELVQLHDPQGKFRNDFLSMMNL
ncbi:FAD-binding protein [Paenibacillus oryzisoli]|uniref:FAD-binding protein n=1 Tax=Paenibacillus oryzisoli TaxID=1850517 RepID=UPI003D2924A6